MMYLQKKKQEKSNFICRIQEFTVLSDLLISKVWNAYIETRQITFLLRYKTAFSDYFYLGGANIWTYAKLWIVSHLPQTLKHNSFS